MSFTSSLPANFTKYSLPGYVPARYVVVCYIDIRYVKDGDVISHDNRWRIFNATKCLANRLLMWSRKIRLLI